MRIRRIELQGFKSFVDRTVFQLDAGVCCVVGPNGCGKSNIIDAIKWSLGEQSPGSLRGRSMEDVIFAGAEDRAPAGRAEVTLVFDNAEGRFGGRYARFDEIQVTRRLDRSGRADYLINKTPARRKDVVDLFLDSGVGARGYSIIEQGRVGFVVNSKPDERRVLIDEVAGINRFKAQRVEAERRMLRTRENLLRISDLLGEMGRQRKALQRQARKADRYRELRAGWKAATLQALAGQALREHGALTAEKDALAGATVGEQRAEQALQQLREAASEAAGSAESARSAHESVKEARAAAQSKLELRRREAHFRAEEQKGLAGRLERLDRDTAEMASRQSTVEAESRAAHQQVAESRGRLVELSARLEAVSEVEAQARQTTASLRAQAEGARSASVRALTDAARARNLAQLLERQLSEGAQALSAQADQAAAGSERIEQLEAGVAEAAVALTDAAGRRADADAAQSSTRDALAAALRAHSAACDARDASRRARDSLQARLDSVRDLLARHEGFGDGVRSVLANYDGELLGTVADLLSVPESSEAAVEAALGPLLQALVLPTPEASDALAAWIEANDLERLHLVVAHPAEARDGSLAEGVDDSSAPGLAAFLLGDARATDGPLAPQPGETLVGPTGRIATTRSLQAGRHVGGGEGALGRQRQADSLADEVAAAEARLQESEQAVRAATDARSTAESALDEAGRSAHAAELAELTARRDQDEAARSLSGARRLAQETGRTREAAELRQRSLAAERESALKTAEEQDAEGARIEASLKSFRGEVDDAETRLSEAARATNALRVEVAALQQAAAGQLREARRIDVEHADLARRLTRAETDRKTAAARTGQLDADRERLGRDVVELESSLAASEGELVAAEEARAQAAARHDEALVAVEGARAELDAARSGARTREVALAEARASLQAHAERAAAEFDVDLLDLVSRVHQGAEPQIAFRGEGAPLTLQRRALLAPGAVESWLGDAVRIAAEVEQIGPVNLAAPAEFREVDARFAELKEQKDDLEKALKDLRRAIARIEKETRERFTEAFTAVAARFALLYPRLVGGGRAELKLTEPDAPLTSGVELLVEPPGKRLQNLTLLSGGEKAMAAIALVFAIFQVKPSPFCLLDEVDAPLDESNSRRFNATLAEMAAETQFVVITHNRTTMEVADVLYGVTMQRPGVSSLVSVRLEDLPQVSSAPAESA